MPTFALSSGAIVEISELLYDFLEYEAVKGTRWTAAQLVMILGELVEEFEPVNQRLLTKRAERQKQIDEYYLGKRKGGWRPTLESGEADADDFERFLAHIGYIETQTPIDFKITTPPLDPEMDQNGPELVTPVTDASMAVGGANARWGSLYDAYFLSDIHPEIDQETQRSQRLRMVVDEINAFLNQHIVQWENDLSFGQLTSFSVNQDPAGQYVLVGHTSTGRNAKLREPEKFLGFNLDERQQLSEFILEDNGLKVRLQLYEGGRTHEENGQFRDCIVESAVTNIIDFEDAVAIVDDQDMVLALGNYLGLIRGDLQAVGSRGNLKTINSDIGYVDVAGNPQSLKATSLMSVRNVSLHVYTDMVKVNGKEIPERILGVFLTTFLAATQDKGSNGEERPTGQAAGPMPTRGPNSGRRYVYQVTPKLQTAEEVAEQVSFFEAVEEKLGLTQGSILIGIMNEELGLTLQLPEALKAAQSRIFFTNTGFLDRTGSQIRVQMYAGPVDPRDDLTQETFNTSYELHNVDVSIQAGVHRHGKIGKGMQVRNRAMAEMLERKIDHPLTGGNTAWVPAPNPSNLHSMHYHMVDVDAVQKTMEDSPPRNIRRRDLLSFPLLDLEKLAKPGTSETLLLRYVHSMMAYVEPWVHRGIGCSGVQNFDQIEEMKDRATERIDGAIIANWKLHHLVTQEDIENAVIQAAEIVDQQHSGTPGYVPMTQSQADQADILKDPAVIAVLQIVDEAVASPSAYVEPALFRNRRAVKASS